MKVNFYLDVGELTSRTLAKRVRMLVNRPKTLADETLVACVAGGISRASAFVMVAIPSRPAREFASGEAASEI